MLGLGPGLWGSRMPPAAPTSSPECPPQLPQAFRAADLSSSLASSRSMMTKQIRTKRHCPYVQPSMVSRPMCPSSLQPSVAASSAVRSPAPCHPAGPCPGPWAVGCPVARGRLPCQWVLADGRAGGQLLELGPRLDRGTAARSQNMHGGGLPRFRPVLLCSVRRRMATASPAWCAGSWPVQTPRGLLPLWQGP